MKVYHNQLNCIQSKFDYVFDQSKQQKHLFQQVSSPVNQIFQGYSLTVFAYGQTGSGKTYTMFGKQWESLIEKYNQTKKQNIYYQNINADFNQAGIIPRSIYSVFKQADKNKPKFQIFCSFLQIYNQKIYDLLQVIDSNNPKALNIHQSKVNGIFVEGLIQFQIDNLVDCLRLLKKGQRNRFIRQTSMNAKSSRSHTIFQIIIQSLQSNRQGNYIKSRLNLCDLAGSQKINKKQVMVNDHLEQLKNINLSLTTLGNYIINIYRQLVRFIIKIGKVINSLSSSNNKKINIAAFRQSKLTRLLQQSLTINTNTFIIGTVSPSSRNIDQTLNTLKFAQRASHITMKIKPIQFNEMNGQSIIRLKKQVQYLKQLLDLKKNGIQQQKIFKLLQNKNDQIQKIKEENISQKDFQRLLDQNRKMKKQIFTLQIDLQKVRSQNNNSSITQRSKISSNYQSSQEYPSRQQLRKQIYLEKFINKKNQLLKSSQNKYQQKQKYNNSMLITAGKATIDNMVDYKVQKNNNQKQNQKQLWFNNIQKQNILNRIQKVQQKKLHQDSLIIQQLENLQNYQIKNNSPFIKNHKTIQILDSSQPKRYRDANVLRRGNNQSLNIQKDIKNQQLLQDYQPQKKKKVDYTNKIKQLQARLYGFK